MGEVLETFVVSSTAISCISSVPQFDGYDPDVLSSEQHTKHVLPHPYTILSTLNMFTFSRSLHW